MDRWLDIGEGDKRISLDLEPDKKPGQLKGKNGCEHFPVGNQKKRVLDKHESRSHLQSAMTLEMT